MAANFSLGDATLNFIGNLAPLNKALGDAQNAVQSRMGKIQSSLSSFSSGMENFAASVRRYAVISGGVVAGAVGLAVKASSDFESSFAGVKKTVDASDADFGKLRQGIVDMTAVIPQSVSDLSRIMEVAGQMGISGVDNLLNFTKTVAMMGDTTNLKAEEAATALGQFINITNGSVKDIDRLASTIVELGNKGSSTEKDITELALRIAGAGKTAGMNQQQILGWAAAVANMGIESEMGGSAVSKLILMMAAAADKGGPKLELMAKISGMTAKQFQVLVKSNPSQALESMLSGLNNIQSSGQSLFGTLDQLGIDEVRLRDTTLRLALGFDKTKGSLKDADRAYIANSALTTEAAKRYETFSSQVGFARNAFGRLLRAFGDPIMAEFTNFIRDKMVPAIKDFAQWVEDNKKKIQDWARNALQAAVEKIKEVAQWLQTHKQQLIDAGKAALEAAEKYGPLIGKLLLLQQVLAPVVSVSAGVVSAIASIATLFVTISATGGPIAAFASAFLKVVGGGGLLWVAIDAFKSAWESVEKFRKGVWDLSNDWSRAFDKILGYIPGLKQIKDFLFDIALGIAKLPFTLLDKIMSGGPGPMLGPGSNLANTPHYASGTNFHPGGMALVGERGPEIVNLPRGSQVIPNGEKGRVGSVVNINGPINVTTSADDTPRGFLKRFEAAMQLKAARAGA